MHEPSDAGQAECLTFSSMVACLLGGGTGRCSDLRFGPWTMVHAVAGGFTQVNAADIRGKGTPAKLVLVKPTGPLAGPRKGATMTKHDEHCTTTTSTTKHGRRRRWGRRVLLSAALLLGLGGVAYAAGPGGHFHHPRTPEEARAHIDGVIEHMMGKVGGTDEQRATLKTIADQTVPRMAALHTEGRDLKNEVRDLLTAEKIDREALEAARKDAIDLADRGSKVVISAVADAAEALTPEQRRKIAEAMAKFQR
jgi:periplasmic protein CpxP/Spy